MYGLEIQSMYDYFSYVAAENLKEMWSQPVEIHRRPSGAEFSDFFFKFLGIEDANGGNKFE